MLSKVNEWWAESRDGAATHHLLTQASGKAYVTHAVGTRATRCDRWSLCRSCPMTLQTQLAAYLMCSSRGVRL